MKEAIPVKAAADKINAANRRGAEESKGDSASGGAEIVGALSNRPNSGGDGGVKNSGDSQCAGKSERIHQKNPAANAPIAAPKLLAKYSHATISPGRRGKMRTSPALISGKVAPSRMDCGRIKAPAKIHLSDSTASGDGDNSGTAEKNAHS